METRGFHNRVNRHASGKPKRIQDILGGGGALTREYRMVQQYNLHVYHLQKMLKALTTHYIYIAVVYIGSTAFYTRQIYAAILFPTIHSVLHYNTL